MDLLCTSYHGTHVFGLDDEAYTFGFQNALEGMGNFYSHALLHLQPPRMHLYDARNLRSSNYTSIRDNATCTLPKNGSK